MESEIELPTDGTLTVPNVLLDLESKQEQQPVQNAAPEPPQPAKRFKSVSCEELADLANSSTAKSTNYQTKWVIKTFKGMFLYIYNHHLFH